MSDASSAELVRRKLRHIDACLHPESQYQTVTTGLERVPWPYLALPELSLEGVDLSTSFLGKRLSAPLLIGAMTGGAEKSAVINKNLAAAAQRVGVGLMLGSQRVMLERPEARASFQVRSSAPDILLIGNLGAAQLLKGYGAAQMTQAVELVGADGLALHLNPLQEAMQTGGDTDWAGIAARLREVVPLLPFPVLLKEVGHGLGAAVARQVAGVGFSALDVAGAGGTSWARVEQLSEHGAVLSPDLCEVGLPTAQAVREVRARAARHADHRVGRHSEQASTWQRRCCWGPTRWRWPARCWKVRSTVPKPWKCPAPALDLGTAGGAVRGRLRGSRAGLEGGAGQALEIGRSDTVFKQLAEMVQIRVAPLRGVFHAQQDAVDVAQRPEQLARPLPILMQRPQLGLRGSTPSHASRYAAVGSGLGVLSGAPDSRDWRPETGA